MKRTKILYLPFHTYRAEIPEAFLIGCYFRTKIQIRQQPITYTTRNRVELCHHNGIFIACMKLVLYLSEATALTTVTDLRQILPLSYESNDLGEEA